MRALTGVVVTHTPGELQVAAELTLELSNGESITAKPGELVYVLHYIGEGYSLLWFRGKLLSDQVPRGSSPHTPDDALRVLRDPQITWWVLIENTSGRLGWSSEPQHFSGADACG